MFPGTESTDPIPPLIRLVSSRQITSAVIPASEPPRCSGYRMPMKPFCPALR